MKTDAKVVILFSDIHVGSTTGLLKPGYVTHEGNEIALNDIQKWLWSCWKDCWSWAELVINNDPWACIVNGDDVEGNHHKTKQIWSPDESDHMMAASEVLQEVLRSASDVYLTEGTEAHTKNMEHGIAKILKGQGINVRSPKGLGAWPELRLEVNGTVCAADHHISTSMRSYLESSAYAISMGDMRNRYARADQRVPKFFVRSHRHQYGHFDDGYGSLVVLPPWQASTRFVRKVVPGAIPQCGLVIADWRTVETDAPPVIHRRLHTLHDQIG